MHHQRKQSFLTPMPAVDICLHQTKQGRILFSLSLSVFKITLSHLQCIIFVSAQRTANKWGAEIDL
jgi:hypothetical protein